MPAVVLKRVGTAVILIPVFVGIVTGAPAWAFVLVVVVVAALAAGELGRMFERAGVPIYGRLLVAAAGAVTASFATPLLGQPAVVPVVVLTLAVAAVLSAPVWLGPRPSVEPVALTLVGVVYVGWFLGHAIALHQAPDGPALILFLAGVTWIGESMAYLVGSTLGRHKLAPEISPNKTKEGAAAQFAASVVAAVGLATWLGPDWTVIRAAGAGALLGVSGQLGDLAESAMKRSVGVKDTGSLIPGHGGLLDRLDGLLFNAPALYYFVALGGRS